MTRVVLLVRFGTNGEIGPFEAAAYEAALRLEKFEITLVSMGPERDAEKLERLSRLGAARAILLTDSAFAGADTLATAKTLAAAIERLDPDFIFCGKKTLEGDTAQVGPMTAQLLKKPFFGPVMECRTESGVLFAAQRTGGEREIQKGSVLSFERIFSLRLPRLGSKTVSCERWDRKETGLEPEACGFQGSPTRVLESFENQSGKRKCNFLSPEEFLPLLSRKAAVKRTFEPPESEKKLRLVFSVGTAPFSFARSVGERVKTVEEAGLLEAIRTEAPDAVLFAGDDESRALSARVAAKLDLGLCADCTGLESDGKELLMIRPAKGGSVIARVRSLTRPALASVRTVQDSREERILCVGSGAGEEIEFLTAFAEKNGFALGGTRKAVESGVLPYEKQIGLTGKTVAPEVYLAVGVSGAVQHLAGMDRSGTVIAVNPDRHAPIFEYADYGFLMTAKDWLNSF